jgi:serine protease
MKNAYTLLIALFAATAAVASTPAQFSVDAPSGKFVTTDDAIPGQYIVILEDRQFPPAFLRRAADHRRDVEAVAEQLAFEFRARRGYVYSEAANGFSVSASRAQAMQLASDPRVSLVAEDAVVEAAGEMHTQVAPPSWGLDRIDQHAPQLDGLYQWFTIDPPAEVHVYVLDTGIRSTHMDFDGRVDVENSYNAFADGNDTNDCNGHGTHIAGTIAGNEHGIAKNAVLHPVRVLTCSGAGSLSAVIGGVDWVTNQVIEHQHPSVANLSLQSSPSIVLDNFIRASVSAGVTYVVAAGNSNRSACHFSPSRISEAITVGASDQNDLRLSTSNYGDCVDLYAPGQAIVSAFRRSDSDMLAMTGTSTAAAHVSGIAANLLAQAPFATPDQVAASILDSAGAMVDPRSGTGYSPFAHSLIDVANDPELGNGGLEVSGECDAKTHLCTFTATFKDQRFNPVRYHWNFGEGCGKTTRWPAAIHDFSHSIMRGPVPVELVAELEDGTLWITTTIVEMGL